MLKTANYQRRLPGREWERRIRQRVPEARVVVPQVVDELRDGGRRLAAQHGLVDAALVVSGITFTYISLFS